MFKTGFVTSNKQQMNREKVEQSTGNLEIGNSYENADLSQMQRKRCFKGAV